MNEFIFKYWPLLIAVAVLIGLGIFFIYLHFGKYQEMKKGTVEIDGHAFSVDIADTMPLQSQGLSGRTALNEDHGMLFVFGRKSIQNFWMKDMNFAIDIVWIDDGKVVGIAKNAAPEPGKSLLKLKLYTSPEPVDTVLEIPAGLSDRFGFKEGDSVRIEL